MSGYYLMHKGWMDNPVFTKAPYTEPQAWEWLISNTVWQSGGKKLSVNGQPLLLGRGQVSHSSRFMADKWGWKKDAVLRFLKRLEKWDMIATANATGAATGQIIITICNYDKYQDPRASFRDSERDSEQAEPAPTPRQPRAKEENILIPKERNNDLSASDDAPPKAKSSKGTRLTQDPDMQCPDEWGEWAEKEFNLAVPEVIAIWEKFRDHWLAKSGKDAVKADWKAAWRNWVRNDIEWKRRK